MNEEGFKIDPEAAAPRVHWPRSSWGSPIGCLPQGSIPAGQPWAGTGVVGVGDGIHHAPLTRVDSRPRLLLAQGRKETRSTRLAPLTGGTPRLVETGWTISTGCSVVLWPQPRHPRAGLGLRSAGPPGR